MSDSWLVIIPVDPMFRPIVLGKQRVQAELARLVPNAEEIEVDADGDIIQFFDCGENFEKVRCGACGAEIKGDEWRDWMRADYGSGPGFRLASRKLSCCGATATLNDLSYEMAQGFGRFCIRAMNYDRGPLTSEEINALSEALGAPVRVIARYI